LKEGLAKENAFFGPEENPPFEKELAPGFLLKVVRRLSEDE
jgi:hypothetical protein